MYEKYGEFDSAAELNRKANELKAEGDRDGVIALAKENGLDLEDAADFYDGTIEELTTPTLAALGKIAAESAQLEMFGVFNDWASEIIALCTEDEDFAQAVRGKGKNLTSCFAAVILEESKRRKNVDSNIVKKIREKEKDFPQNLQVSTMTKKDQMAVIRKYYEG